MTKGSQGRFLLLYGSQTGQAKAIAEEIYENAPNHGLQPEIHCLSMTDKKFSLEKETCLVMVVSTTGDGEPPETAAKFWRRLKKKTLPSNHLANLNYALLGLGDSNYNNFCRNPKNFEQRFEELGAKQFYPSGFADDAVGLEVIVEPWIDDLWPVLCKHLGLSISGCTPTCNGVKESTQNTDVRQCAGYDSDDGTDVDNPYGNKNSENKRTSPDVTKATQRTTTCSNDDKATTSTADMKPDNQRTEASDDPNKRTQTNPDPSDSGSSPVTQDSLRTQHSEGEAVTDGALDKSPSLTCSVPPLSESGLTLPLLQPPYLEVQFQTDLAMNTDQLRPQGSASYPSAQSDVSMATIMSATKLTRDDAVKTALDLELDISDSPIAYQPGDAFSIICPNPSAEVDLLIQRLGFSEQADSVFSLHLIANTKKRRATVPDYIQKMCTVRHVLTHCCDIRTPLKKAFLRMLVEHTENASEKRRLQEFCSKQGVKDYGTFIREACISILDILTAFPSCSPPLGRLLEHLPRLLPRPYSISSSPLVDPTRLHFVFNIVEFPHSQGRAIARQGVCTGWLNHETHTIQRQVMAEVTTCSNDDKATTSTADMKPDNQRTEASDDPNKRTQTNPDPSDSGSSPVTQDSLRTQHSEGEAVTDGALDKSPSLTCSVPPLSESGLTLPLLQPPYLEVQFQTDLAMNTDQLRPQGSASYPSAQSDVSMATIMSATKLTRDDAVKTALDLELDISDSPIAYQPGDAFSIICPNPSAEVDLLIQRLGFSEQADSVFSLHLIANTKKRRATVPDYIQKMCTVRHVLTHCCDIRTPLKKAFLRMLVEHTENASEKRRLQEFCSKQGVKDYGTFIREACISILDILTAFPSCSPPLGRLLEHLPRLLPRPYSISSSPLVDPTRLHFVFNIVEFPHSQGRAIARQGVCTGWLNHETHTIQRQVMAEVKDQEIENDMAALAISQEHKVLIFARTNTHFRLPENPSTPIIMIGPGTGVAPFIGFLEHREMQQKEMEENGDGKLELGPSWLFFGCRHKERDFLYRHKLEHFVKTGILSKLFVSFSRDATNGKTAPKYVQDNLRLHSADVLDLLLEKKAILYVCGDAKNMARNVNETLVELIGKHTGKGAYDSTLILAKLREEKRYREDIWT